MNVGLPGIDEMELMKNAIETLSVRAKLPLSIDSSNIGVIEKALRIYPGRALVNSVSAKAEHLKALLPLIRRYKPMFILLPIGDSGIPQTAEGRIEEIKAAYEGSRRRVSVKTAYCGRFGDDRFSDPRLPRRRSRWFVGARRTVFIPCWASPTASVCPSRFSQCGLVMAMGYGLPPPPRTPTTLMMDMHYAAHGQSATRFYSTKRFAETQALRQRRPA